jgi:hypothetical protein
MTKKTTITFESDSLLVFQACTLERAWCQLCAAEREMIALNNLGVMSNLGPSVLQEWLNSRELHRLQAADGSWLICLNSLLAHVANAGSR